MSSYEELGILHSSPLNKLRLENGDEFFQSMFNSSIPSIRLSVLKLQRGMTEPRGSVLFCINTKDELFMYRLANYPLRYTDNVGYFLSLFYVLVKTNGKKREQRQIQDRELYFS